MRVSDRRDGKLKKRKTGMKADSLDAFASSQPMLANLYIDGKDKTLTSYVSSSKSLSCGKIDFFNLDGALYRILEYLTPSDFYALGVGSKFWKQFLFENSDSEHLFSPAGHPKTCKGRTKLKNIYYFRKSVEGIRRGGGRKDLKRKRKGCCKKLQQQQYLRKVEGQQSLNRVGVLSPKEEDSILSNNTNGYFGLSLFRPGVLAVWGDYSGIFLTSHVDRLFSSSSKAEARLNGADEEPTNTTAKQDTKSMGKEGCGYLFTDSFQVMAILAGCEPYVFLGFASGTIHSIDSRPVYKDQPPSAQTENDPTITETGKTVEYPRISECTYHCQKGEISSLASIENRHVVSSSMRLNTTVSEILIHWNAVENGHLQNISRVKIDEKSFGGQNAMMHNEIFDVSPLAMASSFSIPEWNGPVLSIGARGQNLAHLCLWSSDDPPTIPSQTNKPVNPPLLMEPADYLCIPAEYRRYNARRSRNRQSNHFVYLKYFDKTNLIVGTSKGDVLKIDWDRQSAAPKRFDKCIILNCCKGGMLESVELVGNNRPIMITAGGYDGAIRFWDWETFGALGSLKIHPGQQVLVNEAALASSSTTTRYSPVVSTFFCHERSSLVSFCRDGHLHEWRVEQESKKCLVSENLFPKTASLRDQLLKELQGRSISQKRRTSMRKARMKSNTSAKKTSRTAFSNH